MCRKARSGRSFPSKTNYQCGATWESMDQALRKDPKNPEVRLRAWGVDRVLSGDVITEQNIHALDVACWMLDAEPLRAYGTGGRKRDYVGDCWDHFAVIFYFPNDIVVSFNSHQSGFGYDDILCRAYGLNGTVDTHYFGNVTVKAKEFHSDDNVGNLYTDGVVTNIATFHDNITKGNCANPTVPASVRSNLTTILGRMAAYKNGVVTWQEMMRAKEKFTRRPQRAEGLRAEGTCHSTPARSAHPTDLTDHDRSVSPRAHPSHCARLPGASAPAVVTAPLRSFQAGHGHLRRHGLVLRSVRG